MFTTPMPDDTIESNRPSIQQEHDCRELQCSGKRHNADYNKEYKEQSGKFFGSFTAAGNTKQLEKENNATTALCDKHESYGLKWVS